MFYPKFLKNGSTIGVCAPSDGVFLKKDINKFNNAIKKINNININVKETEHTRNSIKGKSADSKIQAKELECLFLDKDVEAIICLSGGDFLLEILPYINFDIIKENPKWLQGYSDPTSLLYILTTKYDIATLYANNFKAFGMNNWHKSFLDNIEILKGNIIKQESFLKYEKNPKEIVTGLEEYNLDTKVKWENINRDEVNIKGRIIGGCIDILSELFGTKYDNTLNFITKYSKDGTIWYFDNCELSIEMLIRVLWKFKENGWFNYCKGIVFGRSANENSYYDITFREAILRSLGDLNIPLIINADIGHIPPRMTIINGALCNIKSKNGKGSISFELK